MTKHLRIFVWVGVFMFSTPSWAQEAKGEADSTKTLRILKETLDDVMKENSSKNINGLELEIDGLIVDQTLTKVGRDFYEMFYSNWITPKNAKNYTITVKELILPGLATQITVFVNETEVFKQQVQPRYEVLEQMTKYANQTVLDFFDNYERMKIQLEGGDQQGTGIF